MKLPLMVKMVLICLILFSFFRIASPAINHETVTDASEILADQGLVAMSLTLELLNESITTGPSPLTIFAASDDAFKETGQPPLSLLHYHFSPLKLSPESLKTLPYGTTIPTLVNNRSLVITTSESDQQLSLNNVKINSSAVYDVDEMVIYGIERFFDPSFETIPAPDPNQSPIDNLGCVDQFTASPEIVNKLENTHYSVFAQFLNLQLVGIGPETKLTIFVADDDEMSDHLKNFSDYASIFRRHVVPCKLTWTDLVNLDQGTSLPTFLEGYFINITRSGDILILNGVPVVLPDAYSTDTAVVHGIEKMLDFQVEKGPSDGPGSISEFNSGMSPESLPSDYDGGEF